MCVIPALFGCVCISCIFLKPEFSAVMTAEEEKWKVSITMAALQVRSCGRDLFVFYSNQEKTELNHVIIKIL